MHDVPIAGSANSRFWMVASISIGLLAWNGGVAAAGKVYVANEEADTVSVFDTASFKVLATLRVGRMPHNVQVSSDGKVIWVTNNGGASPGRRPVASGDGQRRTRPDAQGRGRLGHWHPN